MGVSLLVESRQRLYSQCTAKPRKDNITHYDGWGTYCNPRPQGAQVGGHVNYPVRQWLRGAPGLKSAG
jgi:hypothetical protein